MIANKKNLTNTILAIISLLCLLSSLAMASTWQAPYVGSDPSVLYLPDTNAVYWRYGWAHQAGDAKGIVIKGTMPNVRYFSYNVYNENTKNTTGSLTDYQIIPDDNKDNPFKAGKDVGNETYTVYIVPKGTKVNAKNVLYFADDLTKVSVFLRHYVPVGDLQGAVSLPTIELYDGKAKSTGPAPSSSDIPKLSRIEFKKYVLPMLEKMGDEFKKDPVGTLEHIHIKNTGETLNIKQLVATQVVSNTFNYYQQGKVAESYNFHASGTYPNNDNHYLVMPVVRSNDEVLIYKFIAPKKINGPQDYPTAPVRYYSLSQGDAATYTHGKTLIDTDFVQNKDGYVYVLIGNESPQIRAKATQLGANFMPWEAGKRMLLVYRHMLPRADFKNGTDKVVLFDTNKPAKNQAASLYISDYAPRGLLVKLADILSAQQMIAY